MKTGNAGERRKEAREEKPTPTLGMELSFTNKFLHDNLRKASETAGVPEGYRKMLIHLEHEDGLTQLELAKRAHVSPPTVSVTLKKMEADGLLTRLADEKDQRTVRVFLTEDGRSLNRRVFLSMMRVDEELVKGFSEEEKALFLSMLRRMNHNLEGMNV